MHALNRENYPVGIVLCTGAIGRSWPTNEGFSSERHDSFREAGSLGLHTQSVPLHFLVISTSSSFCWETRIY